MESFTKK